MFFFSNTDCKFSNKKKKLKNYTCVEYSELGRQKSFEICVKPDRK